MCASSSSPVFRAARCLVNSPNFHSYFSIENQANDSEQCVGCDLSQASDFVHKHSILSVQETFCSFYRRSFVMHSLLVFRPVSSDFLVARANILSQSDLHHFDAVFFQAHCSASLFGKQLVNHNQRIQVNRAIACPRANLPFSIELLMSLHKLVNERVTRASAVKRASLLVSVDFT